MLRASYRYGAAVLPIATNSSERRVMEMYGGFPSILEAAHEMSDGAGGWWWQRAEYIALSSVFHTRAGGAYLRKCESPNHVNFTSDQNWYTNIADTVHGNEKSSVDMYLLVAFDSQNCAHTLSPLSSSPELVLANKCQTKGSITAEEAM